EKLIRSSEVDAVMVATPHYQHTSLGIAALEAGLHLMVEKPISAHKADAERLIAAARNHPKQVFAAMFQLRTEPRYLKIRNLIEVEDNVTAYVEYPNGATGVFITSTGEAPGTNRFEIAGTLGKVVLEKNRLTFARNEADMIEFSKRATVGFAQPEVREEEIP